MLVNQPSVVAFTENGTKSRKKILAMGAEAKEMIGRAPPGVSVVSPIEGGVVSDFESAEMLLHRLVKEVYGNEHLLKTHAVLCVPPQTTELDQSIFQEVAELANLGKVYLIEESMAAALGAGLPVQAARGNMVVDIGGGTTDVAVISLGGIVCCESIRIAGKLFDEKIIEYIRSSRNITIGAQTAENVKIAIGTTEPKHSGEIIPIKGQDTRDGLPKTFEISEAEIYEAIRGPIEEIIKAVRRVLEETPPELSSDILESGITLVGGGALLKNLDQTLSRETGVPVLVAEDPLLAVAAGGGKVLENLKELGGLLRKTSKSRLRAR